MVPVYVGSTAGYSGKSLVTLGLGLKMLEDGLSVGYMKPLGRTPIMVDGSLTDGEARFMKDTLGLPDPIGDICPVVYTQDLVAGSFSGKVKGLPGKVRKAYSALAKGRDAILMSGGKDIYDGGSLGLSGVALIRAFSAKAVVVDPFSGDISVDRLLAVKEMLGPLMIGSVINKVPPSGLDYLRDMVGPYLKKKGIPLLGVLPVDKMLNAITVGQLRESLGGKALCCEDRQDELVENFLIGAMDVESALKYFRKTPNKAVVTGGHRSDIQLAALETSTKCLVLTGDMPPNDLIISKARTAGVPIIMVKHDTLTTVERIEAVVGKTRILENKKVTRARDLMQKHFDYAEFYRKAGIKTR